MKPRVSGRTEGPIAAGAPLSVLPDDPTKSDGRVNRSKLTRKKIVAALTELVNEGFLSPTAEQVSQRAEIGLRTVFRHFDDMNSLYSEIIGDLKTRAEPVLNVRLVGNSWQEKLMHTIDLRAQFFDQIAAIYLSAQVHRHNSSMITESLARDVTQMREINFRILPAVVQNNSVLFEALDLLMSLDAWVRLRRDQQLSADQALSVVRLSVKSLLKTVD
jgi:AcrR family transcriptional regulator